MENITITGLVGWRRGETTLWDSRHKIGLDMGQRAPVDDPIRAVASPKPGRTVLMCPDVRDIFLGSCVAGPAGTDGSRMGRLHGVVPLQHRPYSRCQQSFGSCCLSV